MGAGEGVRFTGQVALLMSREIDSDEEAGMTNVTLEGTLGTDFALVTASNVRVQQRF